MKRARELGFGSFSLPVDAWVRARALRFSLLAYVKKVDELACATFTSLELERSNAKVDGDIVSFNPHPGKRTEERASRTSPAQRRPFSK